LYRLTQADGVGWGTKTYSYDSAGIGEGNPTSFGGVTQRTLGFNTAHQVTSGTGLSGPCSGSTVCYDAAGNVTDKTLDGIVWHYTWTAENRLTSATKYGVLAAQMVYDANGERVKKVYIPASGPTVTTTYVGKMYEKRSYSDASPERHTLYFY